ncbi:MAG: universal stress protein [Pseudomonadota bacterium]|nr:universal stress protein [Pseudomonadota bacterium]
MKLLLAIDRDSDPRIVAAYVAERFGRQGVAIDVVTAIPDTDGASAHTRHMADVLPFPRRRCAHYCAAEELVAVLAAELRHKQGFRQVRSHVEYGDAGSAIVAACLRLNPDLLLMEAPRSRGLLTAFSLDGVTRRVVARVSCPVELLRPHAATPRSLFNVLVPIPMMQPPEFPMKQLQALPWPRGSRLHLMGLLDGIFDDSRSEANPATVALELRREQSARRRARARLEAAARELQAALPPDVEVVYDVADGVSSKTIVEAARRNCASLIALPGVATDRSFRGLISGVSPGAVALAATCSVLLLRPPHGAEQSAPATPHIAPLLPH